MKQPYIVSYVLEYWYNDIKADSRQSRQSVVVSCLETKKSLTWDFHILHHKQLFYLLTLTC